MRKNSIFSGNKNVNSAQQQTGEERERESEKGRETANAAVDAACAVRPDSGDLCISHAKH